MVEYGDVWFSRQTGDFGCKKRLDNSAIDERFANCMEALKVCQLVCSNFFCSKSVECL